jgi:hypothetical protein
VKDAGDVWEDVKQDAAVGLIGLLLAVLVALGVSALWLLSPIVAISAGLLPVVGVVVLVHRMRRPTDG